MKLKLFLTIVLLIGIIIGCGPRVYIHHYSDVPKLESIPPQYVKLLRYEPKKPHIKVGEIVFYPEPGMDAYYVENLLKERTGRMGADALVIVEDKFFKRAVVEDYFWYRKHIIYRERVIVGVAIKFTQY